MRGECRGEDALWSRKILTCLQLDSRSVGLAACVTDSTAHPVQTVSDDVQTAGVPVVLKFQKCPEIFLKFEIV